MSIRVQHLSYTYRASPQAEVAALVDVSFEIADGEFVALIGPTGSGKSTLVQHLNGLLRPPPGTVWVDGIDVGDRRADLRAVRRRVGLVFQYPEYQLFEETVWRDVAFGPRNLGLDEEEVARRVRRALNLVGLDPDETGPRSPFELSGGQKRRVALAGVLALECPTLVLDEPTAGLDPRGRRDLLALLLRLNRSGTTIVLVTHSMEEVARVARRALLLSQGRLVADLPVRDLFYRHAELLVTHGLAVPDAVELVQRLRQRGAQLLGEPLTPEEVVRAIARWKLGAHAAGQPSRRQPAARPDGGQPGGSGTDGGRRALSGKEAARSGAARHRAVRPR